jgi:hypothetical protein
MFRLLLHSLMRGDTREPRTIIEANSWYLIRDPESVKASHTLLQVAFTYRVVRYPLKMSSVNFKRILMSVC